MKTAIDRISECLAVRGRIGDRKIVAESYTVYDTLPVVPKVVRKGIDTHKQALKVASDYLKNHPNGDIVIVSQVTELKVRTTVESVNRGGE